MIVFVIYSHVYQSDPLVFVRPGNILVTLTVDKSHWYRTAGLSEHSQKCMRVFVHDTFLTCPKYPGRNVPSYMCLTGSKHALNE